MQKSSPLISREEAAMIREIDSAATVALRQCEACGFELMDSNKFCRRCGARQLEASSAVTSLSTAESLSSQPTTKLAANDIRGSLFIAVESASLTARLGSPVARTLVAALFAVSVWLVIILLSPLNAWAAAKSAVNRSHALKVNDPERTLYSEA
ncbi:MAG: zinc ribbon domain-containing protein [Acidobacteriota bacterium]